MPVTIESVENGSIAEAFGWKVGAQLLSINFHNIADVLDYRFYASDDRLLVKIRIDGILQEQVIEKDPNEPLGANVEEFRIKHCGDDCIFCFVDQNPEGLRQSLYFRDGDFRMSFLYGNYITMTNMRQRELDRVVEQRLSPLYISVHCTDDEIRNRMMGHRNVQDNLMERLTFLRDHRIEMHTQIVLVPGYNDGDALKKTIFDLYSLNDAIESVSIVPVGLTQHRKGLANLRSLQPEEARSLIETVSQWQEAFLDEIGRRFVYLSDEMYLLAGIEFPQAEDYDGFPLMENGVGMCRDFLDEFEFQTEEFPTALESPKKVTFVTGELAAPVLNRIIPTLCDVEGLSIDLVIAKNILFGAPVTVSGLLSYQCYYEALKGRENGDMILLPPDALNFEGKFMDDKSLDDLSSALGVPCFLFEGNWDILFYD